MLCSELDHASGPKRLHPSRVEAHLGTIGIENLEHLLSVSARVRPDLVLGKRFSRRASSRRIADQSSEVPDQEHDVMSQILKLPEFVNEHGVPEM